jgi:hypothetical protein
MIGLLFALLAIVSQPQPVDAGFAHDVLTYCTPVVIPGTFIGCEDRRDPDNDSPYAGTIWIDGQAVAQTGP